MNIRWAAIKWWAGLPKDKRETVSFGIVIVTLFSVGVFLFKLNNGNDRQQIQQLHIQVSQKDSVIGQQARNHDSIVAAMNIACQERERELQNGTIADYKAAIAEYKQNQKEMTAANLRTIADARRTMAIQQHTNATIKSTNKVLKNENQ